MASNLEEYSKLTRSQKGALPKQELIDILNTAESSPNSDLQLLINNVANLTAQITKLTQSLTDYQVSTTKQIEDLRKQLRNQDEVNVKQSEVIAKQQKYLEQIDRKERECNIVILGVPEDGAPLDDATNDCDKVKKIWNAAGITTETKSLSRLGQPDDDKKRPILVVVPSRGDRDSVLVKAKEMNKAGDVYKYIYIK